MVSHVRRGTRTAGIETGTGSVAVEEYEDKVEEVEAEEEAEDDEEAVT